MGIVIRCLYNNQDWKDACIRPGDDWECKMCFSSPVNIRPPKKDDEVCSGHCWERYLCIKYRWGCTPQGRTFAQAHKGMKVFLVYKHFMGDYTVWATTKVSDVDLEPMQTGVEDEDGFAFIHFEPFSPLPREQWAGNLSDRMLVDAEWRQGRFRYIDKEREDFLERLIKGEEIIERGLIRSLEPTKDNVINIELMPNIRKRLDQVAQNEGRTVEEILREATAEWLRSRES